jgi:hypothetical protein
MLPKASLFDFHSWGSFHSAFGAWMFGGGKAEQGGRVSNSSHATGRPDRRSSLIDDFRGQKCLDSTDFYGQTIFKGGPLRCFAGRGT